MRDYKQQILDKVEYLKKCYIEKDIRNIENLYNILFGEKSNPIVIGTSIDEWCFGEEDVKQLFIDDWKYWGNVSINTQSLVIGEESTFTWFYVNASVEFTFQDSEERYQRYFDSVKRMAQSTKNNLAKAGDIIWNLSTLLHSREEGKRKYLWDITISGLVKIDEKDAFINVMQFSFPFSASFPDVRTDLDIETQRKLNLEQSKIRNYNSDNGLMKHVHIRIKIVEFISKCQQYLLKSGEHKRYIGTNGNRMNGIEFVHYLKDCNYETALSTENIIIKQENDYFIFCASGEFTRAVSLNSEIEQVLKRIDSKDESEPIKEILFKVRRDLAYVIREAAQSEKATFPFRIEGLGKITEEIFCLNYIQVSFPFYWFLEQKTDSEKLV